MALSPQPSAKINAEANQAFLIMAARVLLRLAGRAHLTVTTQAIGETSHRISRYLLTFALLNLGIHGFDVCRYITGEEPKVVAAVTSHAIHKREVEDYAHVTLRTPSGSTA